MAAKPKIPGKFPAPPSWQDAPISTADRRRSERKIVQAVGKLSAPETEKHLRGRSVTVMDLSLHGVGFHSPVALVVGNLYGLQMTSDWMNLSSRMRVIACKENEKGEWEVGAEFA